MPSSNASKKSKSLSCPLVSLIDYRCAAELKAACSPLLARAASSEYTDSYCSPADSYPASSAAPPPSTHGIFGRGFPAPALGEGAWIPPPPLLGSVVCEEVDPAEYIRPLLMGPLHAAAFAASPGLGTPACSSCCYGGCLCWSRRGLRRAVSVTCCCSHRSRSRICSCSYSLCLLSGGYYPAYLRSSCCWPRGATGPWPSDGSCRADTPLPYPATSPSTPDVGGWRELEPSIDKWPAKSAGARDDSAQPPP